MANDNNEQLTYELQATFDKFATSFDQATKTAADSFSQMEARGKDAGDRMTASIQSAVSSISSSFQSLQAPAKSTGDVIGAVIGGSLVAAAVGFAGIMDKLINALADAGDRAADLRLPINILQALSVAADEARVPSEKLNSALNQFTSVSKKSADEAKEFYKALGNIGPAFVKAFQSAPTQAERLRILMDAFKSTTDEAKRANLAQTAFGSDNERLISIMSGGRGAIADYIDEMRKLGLEIDESAVKKAQAAKSALSLLARVMTDELSSALAELIPSFKEFLPMLEKVAGYVRDTVSGFASPENRPLSTLKNDAQAAEEHIADLQKQLNDLNNYKPVGGLLGDVGQKMGVDIEAGQDSGGKFSGVAVDIAKARSDIQAEIASTQSALDQYKNLIAQKQKIEDDSKGHDGAEASAFKPRPSLTEKSDKSGFDKATNAVNRHIAAMRADAAAVGLTDAAHQRLRAELELLQAAQRDDKTITEQQIDTYARLRTSMSAEQAMAAAGIKLSKQEAAAFSQTSSRMEEAAQTLDRAKQQFQGANDAMRFAGDQLIDVFDKAQGRAQSWQQIMTGVLQQVEKQMLQAAVTGSGAFAKLIPGVASSNGGVGGLMGALLGLFGGARAGGGDVSPDRAYLVGEKGPELWRPKVSGSIVPSHKLALGGGTRNSVMHNYVNNVTVNAAGGSKDSNEDLARQVARSVHDSMREMVSTELRTQMRPGGIVSNAKPY